MQSRIGRLLGGVMVVGVALPLLLLLYHTSRIQDAQPREDATMRGLKLVPKSHFAFNNVSCLAVDRVAVTPAPSLAGLPTASESLAEHVWRTCKAQEEDGKRQPLASLTPQHYDHIIVDDKYKMLYCYVPKVACTNWKRVLLALSGKVHVNNVLEITPGEVHGTYKQSLPLLSSMTPEEIEKRLSTYYKFMFVREPFERLLSAWRNKFFSNSTSSRLFRRRYVRQILNRLHGDPEHLRFKERGLNKEGKMEEIDKVRVSLSEFLAYLVDPVRVEEHNEHWARFTRLCRPCHIQYDFVGKYESINADATHVLHAVEADNVVSFPTRSDTYKSNRTANYLQQLYADVSPGLMRRVYQTFRQDFDLFRYDIPAQLRDKIRNRGNDVSFR